MLRPRVVLVSVIGYVSWKSLALFNRSCTVGLRLLHKSFINDSSSAFVQHTTPHHPARVSAHWLWPSSISVVLRMSSPNILRNFMWVLIARFVRSHRNLICTSLLFRLRNSLRWRKSWSYYPLPSLSPSERCWQFRLAASLRSRWLVDHGPYVGGQLYPGYRMVGAGNQTVWASIAYRSIRCVRVSSVLPERFRVYEGVPSSTCKFVWGCCSRIQYPGTWNGMERSNYSDVTKIWSILLVLSVISVCGSSINQSQPLNSDELLKLIKQRDGSLSSRIKLVHTTDCSGNA